MDFLELFLQRAASKQGKLSGRIAVFEHLPLDMYLAAGRRNLERWLMDGHMDAF